jgi:hypothetical protein
MLHLRRRTTLPVYTRPDRSTKQALWRAMFIAAQLLAGCMLVLPR